MQALNNGEVDCMALAHKDADVWACVWERIYRLVNEGLRVEVAWVQAHTAHKEKTSMSSESRRMAQAGDKADELAESGAELDGADHAETIAQDAFSLIALLLIFVVGFHKSGL